MGNKVCKRRTGKGEGTTASKIDASRDLICLKSLLSAFNENCSFASNFKDLNPTAPQKGSKCYKDCSCTVSA